MLQFLLDTDHLTLYERGHPPLLQRIRILMPGALGTSAVTVEEALRGRLGYLSRPLPGPARVRGYALLVNSVKMFSRLPIAPYDQTCELQYQTLRAQQIRVGTQDLRIAATALVNTLTILTRNQRDFSRVPGLQVEDWSV